MQGIGMLTKVPYIKTYTMQNHPVQGLTVNIFLIGDLPNM